MTRQLYKDILNGRKLNDNIPSFLNHMAGKYYTYSAVRLALHYYTFYEAYRENENVLNNESNDVVLKINDIINKGIVNKPIPFEYKRLVQMTRDLRSVNIKRTDSLYSITDIFKTYEYVLNRVEYRFMDNIILEDDNEFARDVLRYIFDSHDNVIINEKIRGMIGQLPIRITKQKFYEILRNSIQKFEGAEVSALKTHLYIIRTSGMLRDNDSITSYYPSLKDKLESLENTNFKELTKHKYDEAYNALVQATSFLNKEIEIYYSLQEIINDLYTMIICMPYYDSKNKEYSKSIRSALSIIEEVNFLFLKKTTSETYDNNCDGCNNELPVKTISNFQAMEGVQEELLLEFASFEEGLYLIDKNYRNLTKSLNVDKLLDVLLLCKDLSSSSLFIDFDEIKDTSCVDRKMLEEEGDKLISEFSTLFTKNDKVIMRAVMANTLNKLPVFFDNRTQVMDYVRYSLNKCTDLSEKKACNILVRHIISE